jgi:high-affinity nickel-transport protein
VITSRTSRRVSAATLAGRAVVRLFHGGLPSLKVRLAATYSILAVLNIGVWVWVFAAFCDKPVLLGISSLIYGLGLRHAVDANHIAAIDNVTRKLMQENKRPVAVGFFFAMGHSTIVFLLASFVAGAATVLSGLERFKDVGGTISTSVSACSSSPSRR